jgi:dienelactone hydrolase
MGGRRGRLVLLAAATGLLGIIGLAPLARTAAAEIVTFPSVTIANMGQVVLGPSSNRVVVTGELDFPKTKAERYPAAVIAHASGGYVPANDGWFADELNKAGFATLVYDSFKTRMLGSQIKGGNPSTLPSAVADAFAALNFLAGEPRIEPSRISILGFSFGGEVAQVTAFERLRMLFAPEHRFAAHVGLYPALGFGSVAGPHAFTGAGVLFLLGEKDETVPAEKMQQYLAYLRRAATNVVIETVTYPGAYHAWTNPNPMKPTFFPDLASGRSCPLVLIGEKSMKLLVDGKEQIFDPVERQQCLQNSRGYTMGFNADVRAKSLADTVAFLRKIP